MTRSEKKRPSVVVWLSSNSVAIATSSPSRRASICSREGGSASHRSSGPSGRSASRMRRVSPVYSW